MIYSVRHSTRYDYGSTVDLAAHLLHLRPRDLPGQRVLSAGITAVPAASRRRDALDHFGNHVTWLFLDQPHATFEVVGEAVVEVGFPAPPPAAATLPWERVAACARAGGPAAWQAAEFTFDSPMVPIEAAAGAYAAESFPRGRPVLEGLLELNTRIRREFAYRPGATSLATPVAEVLKRRQGVCQDFSHVMISALRALGLPARYVSGYIRTLTPPGQPRRRGADQSHAWVGCWLGPEHGWVDLDPTNNAVVRDEHLVVGWGRDYADVSPVSGVVLGGGAHGLTIGVDLEPLAVEAAG
ncbi:transglutaminase family protein [Belnapia rosea]|uniref:Transglutaminase-like enzyme, putative cysteine protease n=1 Tax=Belnapia rosea TaxID=938405 RepID=A0A1G7B5P0_9PROT|nr:transglutaminase family protein [Belnapia rosea]SDB33000.1 Transglutaminase-like enzyme, putative cysteine protease [Belnapia rosea]SDE22167.1 Transglutaminase-like enzyme, putative cysteine protease [Belnapia rosea]